MPYPVNSGGRGGDQHGGAEPTPPVGAPVASFDAPADTDVFGPGYLLVARDTSTGVVSNRTWQVTVGVEIVDLVNAAGPLYQFTLPAGTTGEVTLTLLAQNRAVSGQSTATRTWVVTAGTETTAPSLTIVSETTVPGISHTVTAAVDLEPDAGYATSLRIEWGDGTQTTVFSGSPSVNFWPSYVDEVGAFLAQQFTHVYANPGTYTVRAVAASSGYYAEAESDGVDVYFAPLPTPTLAVETAFPVYGQPPGPLLPVGITVAFAAADLYTALVVNWGDGGFDTLPPASAGTTPVQFTHDYLLPAAGAPDAVYTIVVQATGPGGVASVQSQITVPAAPPAPSGVSVIITVLSSSYAAGVTVRADFAASGVVSTRTVNWGDGSSETVPVGATQLFHFYTPLVTPVDRTVVFTATGPGGSTSSSAIVPWPQPAAPTVSAAAVETGRTATAVIYQITYQVSGGPASSLSVSYDGNAAVALAVPSPASPGSLAVAFANATAEHTAEFEAVGPTGLVGSVTITVNTVASAPTLGIGTATMTPSGAGFALQIAYSVSNSTTLTADWGDGTPVSSLNLAASSATHLYAAVPSGQKTVTLTATNAVSGLSVAATAVVTVPASSPTLAGSISTPVVTAAEAAVVCTFTSAGEISSQSIDWGDGTVLTSPTGITAGPSTAEALTHAYDRASPGTKVVTLTVVGPASVPPAVQTFVVTVPAVEGPSGSQFVKLLAVNGATVALAQHPVDCTVSFSTAIDRAAFFDADLAKLRVYASGADGAPSTTQVPAQFRVLSRHHGARSDASKAIRNLQVTFVADVPAAVDEDQAGLAVYWLRTDADAAVPVATGALQVTENAGAFFITQAGQPQYVLSKTLPSLLHAASVNGVPIVQSDGVTSGFAYSDQTGARTFSVASTVVETGLLQPPGASVPVYNVKVVVRQTGTISTGAAFAPKYTARWTFLHGQPDVEFEFTVHNPARFQSQSATSYFGPNAADLLSNALRIDRLYLGMQLASVSQAKAQRAGLAAVATALSATQTFRALQTFRERRFRNGNVAGAGAYGGIDAGKYDAAVVDGRMSTEHLLTLEYGVDSAGTEVDGEKYPGALYAGGAAGGVTVSVEHFAHKAPKSLEASATGALRVGMFPDTFPGGTDHPRGWEMRPGGLGAPSSQYLSAQSSVASRPGGTNPATGGPWRANEVPTAAYPGGTFGTSDAPAGEAKPSSPGSGLNQVSPGGVWIWTAQVGGRTWPSPDWHLKTPQSLTAMEPYGAVHSDFRDYYVLFGGRQATVRLRFRVETSAPASPADHARLTDNPPIGLCDAARLRAARGPTATSWAERTQGEYLAAGLDVEPDLRRGERWLRTMTTDAASDAFPQSNVTNPSGALFRAGAPTLLRMGASPNNNPERAVGWDRFGGLNDAGAMANHRYDPLLYAAAGLLRYRDAGVYSAYRTARAFAAWSTDFARVLCDDPTYILTGLDFYETGFPQGVSHIQPQFSHTFVVGLSIYYAMTGDERAAKTLRYAARSVLVNQNQYDPSAYVGVGGNRLHGWAMRTAAAIYHVLGPLSVPTPVGGATSDANAAVGFQAGSGAFSLGSGMLPAAGRDLRHVLLGGLTRWRDLQAGVVRYQGVATNPPCNFIPDTYLSGRADAAWPSTPTVAAFGGQSGRNYSNNGVILSGSSLGTTAYTGNSDLGAYSPFMETFCFVSMAEALRALDGLTSAPAPAAYTAAQIASLTADMLLVLHRMRLVIRNGGPIVGTAATTGFIGNVTPPGFALPLLPGTPVVAGGTPNFAIAGLPLIRQRWAPADRVQRALDAYANDGLWTGANQAGALINNTSASAGYLLFGNSGPVFAGDTTTCLLLAWLFAEASTLFGEYAGKARADGAGAYADYASTGGGEHDLPLAKYFYRAGVRYALNAPSVVRDVSPPPAASVYSAAGEPLNPATPTNGGQGGTSNNLVNYVGLFTPSWSPVGVAAVKQLLESMMPGLLAVPAARLAAGEIVNP